MTEGQTAIILIIGLAYLLARGLNRFINNASDLEDTEGSYKNLNKPEE